MSSPRRLIAVLSGSPGLHFGVHTGAPAVPFLSAGTRVTGLGTIAGVIEGEAWWWIESIGAGDALATSPGTTAGG